MLKYSIIIPMYNEEAVITSSLTRVLNFMKTYCDLFEILVVDDGSEDDTVKKVEKYKKDHPEIVLIKNPHKGKAYAVRTGMLMAKGEYMLMVDADMATPIEELKRLMVWVKDHDFDIVIASREGIGSQRHGEPWIRHFMGRVFNFIVRMLTIPGIQDTQCGFKVFKKKVAYDIFKSLVLFGPDTPETNVPRVTAFDVEILMIAKRNGYSIKEVPISWTYVSSTRVHPIRDSLSLLWDVLRVKFNDVMGKYNNY